MTSGDPYYNQRGLILQREKVNPVTGTRDYLNEAIKAGEPVHLSAQVYNFALRNPTGVFDVLFQYQEMDQSSQPVGVPQDIRRDRFSLEPLATRLASVVWDTAGLGGVLPGQYKSYRIIVTVDPDNQVPNEIHELFDAAGGLAPGTNNRGHWPWTDGVKIYSPESQLPPGVPLDLSASPTSLAIVFPDGTVVTENATVKVGQTYLLRATIDANTASHAVRPVVFLEGAPGESSRAISIKPTYGMNQGSTNIHVRWTPKAEDVGRLKAIHVRAHEDHDDPVPGNAVDSISVNVVE